MRSLSSTLTTAQKSGGSVLVKVALTKTGQTSRTYVNTDASNPLIIVTHNELARYQNAEVIIDNSDSALSSLDLRGFQAIISNGYTTSAGDEYSAKPPLYVITPRFETYGGGNVMILPLASKVNQMARDRANYDYTPAISDTSTIQTIAVAIGDGSYSTIGTSDLAGAVKTQAAVGASSVALKSLGTGTINEGTKFLIAGDNTEYTLTATATIASNEATVSITPTLQVQADVDDVVTLLDVFSHCENISIGGSVDTDKDPVINSFKPADFFRIHYGDNRWAKLDELMAYTFTVLRWESTGDLRVHHFVNSQCEDWAASTVIRKGETRKPTVANGHIYTCTTAGTTGGSEPTWVTTEGQTVTDNTVTWTLDYAYQYTRTNSPVSGDHLAFRKGKSLALIVPNRVTVESDPKHSTIYSGMAKDSDSNDLFDLRDKIRLRLTSVDEATNIAKGFLGHKQIETEVGWFIAPFNVGLELYDLVRLYDASDGTSLIGNVLSIHNRYSSLKGQFDQIIRLGINSVNLDTLPSGLSYPDRSESQPATYTDLDYLKDLMFRNLSKLQDKIDGIAGKELSSTAQVNSGTDALRVITPDVLAGSVYGEKIIGTLVEEGATSLSTGDDKNGNYFRIPASYNGWNIVAVAAQVRTAGTTGTTDIQLRNITDSVDVLSTKITIDSGEKDSKDAATPAVINTANDDVATGDEFTWDVDAVQSGTAPKGLYCEVTLRAP